MLSNSGKLPQQYRTRDSKEEVKYDNQHFSSLSKIDLWNANETSANNGREIERSSKTVPINGD